MPTPQEIEKGVFDNARLEVAKKLKVLIIEQKGKAVAAALSSEDYLRMADEAIKKREITIGTETVKLQKIEDDIKNGTNEEAKRRLAELGGSIQELVPTEDQLKKVAAVATRSVKQATGPLTVMGTSLFTLITAFFQTLGDLFSGNMQGKGFFERLKEHAAETTGNKIGNNLRRGLNNLRQADPKMAKWLNIDEAVAGAQRQARIAAGVEQPGPSDVEVLNSISPDQVMANYAKKQIHDSVQKDILGIVSTAVGTDIQVGGMWATIKRQAGVSASNDDAEKITNKITDAITKVMTDPNYEFGSKKIDELLKPENKQLLKDALKAETKKALEEYSQSAGTLSFRPGREEIVKVLEQMDGYVDKNYDMLKDLSKKSRGGAGAALPSQPVDLTRAAGITPEIEGKIQEVLKQQFDSKFKQQFVDQENEKRRSAGKAQLTTEEIAAMDNDPFIKAAREKFIELGTKVIAARGDLVKAKKWGELRDNIIGAMLSDADFKNKAVAKVRETLKNPSLPEDQALSLLVDDVGPKIDKFFNDSAVSGPLSALIPDGITAPPSTGPGAASPRPSVPAMSPDQKILIKVQAGLGLALTEALQDGNPANKATIEMFNSLTGLDASAANYQARKTALIAALAEGVTQSGIIVTPSNPGGVFKLDESGSEPKLQLSNTNIIEEFRKERPAGKIPDSLKEAFTKAKDKIAAKLKSMKDKTGITDDDKINAIAENAALQMFNQALPPDLQIEPKNPAHKFFVENQTKVAGAVIEEKIMAQLRDFQILEYAGVEIEDLSKSAAKALTNVAAQGITDQAAIKAALIKQLTEDKVISNPEILNTVVDKIAKGYADTAKGKPAPTREEQLTTRTRNAEDALALIQQQVAPVLNQYKDEIKQSIKAQPIWLAPEKAPWGTQWLARRSKKNADRLVNASVDSAVELAAKSVDQELLKNTIANAALKAARQEYVGPDGKTLQFHQLTKEQQKKAVAAEVRAALENSDTFAKIFPSRIPLKISGVGVEMHILPDGVKQNIINTIVGKVESGITTAPTTTVAMESDPTMPAPPSLPRNINRVTVRA